MYIDRRKLIAYIAATSTAMILPAREFRDDNADFQYVTLDYADPKPTVTNADGSYGGVLILKRMVWRDGSLVGFIENDLSSYRECERRFNGLANAKLAFAEMWNMIEAERLPSCGFDVVHLKRNDFTAVPIVASKAA